MIEKFNSRRALRLAGIIACLLVTSAPQARSEADCAARADRAARDSDNILGGAVNGALTGGIFGAIVGNSKSAKRGAILGSVVGGLKGSSQKNATYKRTYDNCMRRG